MIAIDLSPVIEDKPNINTSEVGQWNIISNETS